MQNNVEFSTRNILSRRYIVIVFFVLLGIAGVYTYEHFHLRYTQTHWDAILAGERSDYQKSFDSNFAKYQSEVWDIAKKVASDPKLLSVLQDSTAPIHLAAFDVLSQYTDSKVSIELYNSRLELIGWSGVSGAPVESLYFNQKEVSFILQGPLYSYLIVISPIHNASLSGYVIAKKLFDVNYPLNNRFINNGVFASTFDAQMAMTADFDFSSVERFNPKGNQDKLVLEMKGIDGAVIGYASLDLPLLINRLKDIEAQEARLLKLLIVIFILLLSYLLWKVTTDFKSVAVKIFLTSFAIWFFRYGLIWANFPSDYIRLDVFDPVYFTSPLGFGLAKSVGDLFISSIFLFVNLLYAGFLTQPEIKTGGKPLTPLKIVFGILHLTVTVFLFFTIGRGFLSAMHSAVVESNLHYNDPMYVVPPFILSLMLISLFLMAISLVCGSILLIRSTGLNFKSRLFPNVSLNIIWVIIFCVFVIGAIAYGWFVSNPLSDAVERVDYTVIMFLIGWGIMNVDFNSKRFQTFRTVFLITGVAIIVVLYTLDNNVHEADRVKVEAIASRVLKPADIYLTSLVNQALDELSSVDADSLTTNSDNPDIQKLAFLGWSGSVLSREGFNCRVGYSNREGDVVSDFHLGLLRHSSLEPRVEPQGETRMVRTEEKNIYGEIVKVYHGYAPVFGTKGELIGGVSIDLSADKQALLGSDTPEILQNYTSDQERRFIRKLILSDYMSGKLIYTTGENLPKDRPISPEISRIGNAEGVWIEESIDGKNYETYLIPRLENTDTKIDGAWLALSMENLDFRWHLFSILRIVIFYIVLLLLILGIILAVTRLRGEKIRVGFRTKLLAAFMVAALIPIGILAYYNREYAMSREEEQTSYRLHEETDEVVTSLQKVTGINVPFDLTKLQDEACGDIANDLGSDFNVYSTRYLQASSKPELFMAELFDSRLSAGAYSEMILKKKSFYSEHQTIGNYTYVVGYRPLLSETGSVIGVVSVPTLYHQKDIDNELMQRNAYLFGAYILAMLIALGMGVVFANQISSPVIRLREATKQIAGGDLSVRLASGRNDEFGDLERAFDRMTSELQEAQEKTVRAQREMAWKEMAKQVAHEIKNPLTPMKLSVQHLRQAYADGVKDFGVVLEKITSTLLDQVESLSRIASEFSNFARMPERRLKECDIDEIVNEAMELFTQHEHIQFSSRFESHGTKIVADREEIRRMFINIIQNAVQAIDRKGKIFIQTIGYPEHVEIEIADTGKGVPAEIRHKLFEPNFSTKSEGMGLGLAIVKKTIDDLHGSISIQSEPGLGTKVKIVLPIESSDLEG
ncbi:MAG: ATP-binding protein [Bacteroidota bacterium]